jgi:hypothetical protein
MAKWDIYAKANPDNYYLLSAQFRSTQGRPSSNHPLFKSNSIEDYSRFRSTMQAIDLAILDLSH